MHMKRATAWDSQGADQHHRMGLARRVGIAFVFLWFFVGGIAHFAATALEMSIVPPYIPSPHAVVIVTGVFELLGAAGLLLSRTRRIAGWGLMVLTVCVTPANVYMLQRADLFNIPYWILVLRLPLQLALLALIYWSSRPLQRRAAFGRF
jgi:uncharacterized membrane protein